MQRVLLAGLACLAAAACAAPAASARARPPLGAAERQRVEAELAPFETAFAALEAALRERDDALARRILARVLAREPRGAALERARAFERILEGREWVASLDLRLAAEREGDGDSFRVRALASHTGDADLLLRGAPPTLRLALLGVSPEGLEQRFSQSAQIEDLAEWRIPAGATSEMDLGAYDIPTGSALAVRALFALEFLPGDVVRDGVVRPASRLPVARTEVVRLASFLPGEPVAPAELARYVREELIRTPPLLERAVRIAPAERALALDALTPAALELPSGELEKLIVALRWLSGRADLGIDARGWRQWLAERARLRAGGAPADRPAGEPATAGASALDLPDERP